MPPALFDDCSLRKGNKSSIVRVLDGLAPSGSQPPSDAVYTIDGGHLLHHVVWQHPAMDRSVSNTNSTRQSGMDVPVSCLMDMTL